MNQWIKTCSCAMGVVAMAMLSGCYARTVDELERLPDDHKGAKVVYQGNGDEVALGGGKGVHYERSF